MAETCIVCLGDLRTEIEWGVAADDLPPPPSPTPEAADAGGATSGTDEEHQSLLPAATTTLDIKRQTRANLKRPSMARRHHRLPLLAGLKIFKRCSPNKLGSLDADEETIAHLLPCKHDLHNACLKPWVERANSCPICRATFNMVELSRTIGGEVLDSYSVQDKRQEAELDPSMVVDDELFAIEVWEPCMLCGVGDDTHALMWCDGCDKAVHVFCAGFTEAVTPEIWYCETCLGDMEGDTRLPGTASALGRQPRRRVGTFQRRGQRNNDAIWARVWQEVSRRIDLDLDFPFDEEQTDERTPEQRAEFRRWERRFAEVNRQGATNRLQGVAAANLQPARPDPESQEEIRAWNAFDKARASQDEPHPSRRNKRKATESPTSPREPQEDQRQLKRPRLRRPRNAAPEPVPIAESSAAAQRKENTFLSFLLKDVENKPVSAGSPCTSDMPTGQWSPRNSSPVRSPTSSGYVTPRALSVTPPPQRPASPSAPAYATIPVISSPLAATYSPFSPSNFSQDVDQSGLHPRGRRRYIHDSPAANDKSPVTDRAFSASPSRALSYSAKEEIQRMVKLSLGPRYRNDEITKDQYTTINRDVSRKLYDLVGDASALSDQAEREKWQSIAESEVKIAIAALPAVSPPEHP